MADAYEINRVLEEIAEDEKAGSSRNKKVSQKAIKAILIEKRQSPVRLPPPSDTPLKKALLLEGIITETQLEKALKLQKKTKGKISSILSELGYFSDQHLLSHFAKHVVAENRKLFDIGTGCQAMGLLPLDVMLKYKVLPLMGNERTILLAMDNPKDLGAINEVEFLTGKRVNPVVVPASQMKLALLYIKEKANQGVLDAKTVRRNVGEFIGTSPWQLLLRLMGSTGHDLLISADASPMVKTGTALSRIDVPPITAAQCSAYARALMSDRQWESFLRDKEIDFTVNCEPEGRRFRIHAYKQKNTVSLVVRRIQGTIPSLQELRLPRWLEDFASAPRGLILIVGPPGQGKTTSVAAMIDLINKTRTVNIITLEDPIEYFHRSEKSNINQREIGSDIDSYLEGMSTLFRQAADVLVIGELRDHETMGTALNAASAGCLVICTMIAGNTTAALENMVSSFPRDLRSQVRHQISESLLLVFSQVLLPGKGSANVVLAHEKLINSSRIKDFIRGNAIHKIRSQFGAEPEDFSALDTSLAALLGEGLITLDSALAVAGNPEVLGGCPRIQ